MITLTNPNTRTADLTPCSPRAARIARTCTCAAAWSSIAVGVIVLIGWIVDSAPLKGAIGIPITMKANAATCFVLAGIALLLSLRPIPDRGEVSTQPRRPTQRRIAQLLSLAVILVGATVLIEHATGWNFGIDQLLFTEPPGEAATSSPGRMGPPAALGFLCIGLSLLCLDRPTRNGRYPFRSLAVLATLISLVSVTGYLFGSPALYATVRRTEIAWPTAATLLALSLGVLAARPDNLILQTICSPGVGSIAARRLLIASLIVPFFLLWAYGLGRQADLFDAPFGQSILAVMMMIALTSVVLITAHRINLSSERQAGAERQLRRHERDLTDFFENAVIGLHWMGSDGIILRANRADMQLLGYTADEYVGHHIAEFHADRDVTDDIIRRMQAGEELRDFPARLRCKNGALKDVLIDSSVLWEDGRFVHTRCFTRDITERRRADIISKRLSAIVESSADAIVGLTLDGVVMSWNRAAERVFGYTADEMIGNSIMTLIPPDLTDEEVELLARIRRGETVEHYESTRRAKHGALINVSLTISPILDGLGRVIGASKIARDITERRRHEAEREALFESERAARADAERAARLRDEFLAVVSHELRTPLNIILGWAQLLQRSRNADPTISDGVDAIEHAARAQVQLIKDLLDMNRIMTGKLQLDVTTVPLAIVIESAIGALRPAAESKHVEIHAAIDTDAGPVIGDPNRLQQVVWNLLSNAVKFTPENGRIDVQLHRKDTRAEIVVSDTGVGIAPEFLPHVFERFRQADSSISRSYGGLGLGLSIVKQLVEMHDGSVHARSQGKNQGATFVVELPLAPVPDAPHRTHAIAGALHEAFDVDLSAVRVLVVDDDPESRELAKRVLAQCHAQVQTAGSAAEALALLPTCPFDVLISDIGMPVMDGYQFIRKVRALPAAHGGAIPAIAFTAYARSEDRTRAMMAGYQMHISKPIEPQELIATVASFANRTASDPA